MGGSDVAALTSALAALRSSASTIASDHVRALEATLVDSLAVHTQVRLVAGCKYSLGRRVYSSRVGPGTVFARLRLCLVDSLAEHFQVWVSEYPSI